MRSSLAPGYCAGISYRLVCAGFSAGLAFFLTFAVGCPSPKAGSTGKGSLSIPEEGKVRVVASEIEKASANQHFKWSVIGERNWTKASASGGVLSLGATYPINSPTQSGGCNIYEADVTAKAQGDTLVWETRLHGSDGTTVTEKGKEALNGRTFADVFQVRQTDSTVAGLPADLLLARIGERDVRLKIDK